jgi:hypothetical protein
MLAIALCVLAAVLSISPAALGQDLQATLNNISKVPIDIRQKFGVCAYQTIAKKMKSGQFPTRWLKDASHGGDFYLAVAASCGEDMVAFAKSAKDLGFSPKDISNMLGLVAATAATFYSDAQKSR